MLRRRSRPRCQARTFAVDFTAAFSEILFPAAGFYTAASWWSPQIAPVCPTAGSLTVDDLRSVDVTGEAKLVPQARCSLATFFVPLSHKKSQCGNHKGDPATVMQQGCEVGCTNSLAKECNCKGCHDDTDDSVFKVF